ncbi:MAG: type II secretion system F family protein [Tepidiformaceae bacterium]
MSVSLMAAFAAALTAFVGVGALSGQFGQTQRRLLARAISLERKRAEPERPRNALLKADALARSAAPASFLRRFDWAINRALLLERGAVPLKVSEYLVIAGVLFAVATLLITLVSGLVLVGLAFGVVALVVLEVWTRDRANKRLALFHKQLPTALDVMATSLKSGFGIMEAVQTVGKEMEDPLAGEFTRIINEACVGGSFEDSMARMVERIESRDLPIVVRALEAHRRVGGDLGAILESVAVTMREREELRGHVAALVAQQRFGAIIVGLLPAYVVGFMLVFDPGFISPLWEETAGRLMFAAGITMEVLAFFMMSRITKIEV